MLFAMHDDSDSTQIAASRYHANVPRLELDVIGDLSGGDVNFDAILGFDQRIWVPDSATISSGEVRNTLRPDRNLFDDTKLVRRLLFADTMDLVSSFHVINEPEIFPALLHLNDVHKAGRVSVVGSNSSVDFDQALGENLLDFRVVESVLETIPQEERQRQTFPELVGTGRGPRGITSSQLVEHPVLGRRHTLHVLTGTANHFASLKIF